MLHFFIGIGLGIHLDSLTSTLWLTGVLVFAAFTGMFLGSAVPALVCEGWRSSLLLGLSMIPRAEVAMIIMQRTKELVNDVMPNRVFTAMVITCLATCIVPPIILKRVIHRWLKLKKQ